MRKSTDYQPAPQAQSYKARLDQLRQDCRYEFRQLSRRYRPKDEDGDLAAYDAACWEFAQRLHNRLDAFLKPRKFARYVDSWMNDAYFWPAHFAISTCKKAQARSVEVRHEKRQPLLEKAHCLRAQGVILREIAEAVQRDKATVCRWLKIQPATANATAAQDPELLQIATANATEETQPKTPPETPQNGFVAFAKDKANTAKGLVPAIREADEKIETSPARAEGERRTEPAPRRGEGSGWSFMDAGLDEPLPPIETLPAMSIEPKPSPAVPLADSPTATDPLPDPRLAEVEAVEDELDRSKPGQGFAPTWNPTTKKMRTEVRGLMKMTTKGLTNDNTRSTSRACPHEARASRRLLVQGT